MTQIGAKLRGELRSFYALSLMNIVFGGISMALGISYGIQNVLALKEMMTLLWPQTAFMLIGFVVFGVSLRWLLSSVEIFDGISDMHDDYEQKRSELTEETATSLVVKMMAYYRSNKPTIQRLSQLSRIAGICFLANGLLQTLNTILAEPIVASPLSIIGITLNLAIGGAGLLIPHFFHNYSSVWEYRLQQSMTAEQEFDKALERH